MTSPRWQHRLFPTSLPIPKRATNNCSCPRQYREPRKRSEGTTCTTETKTDPIKGWEQLHIDGTPLPQAALSTEVSLPGTPVPLRGRESPSGHPAPWCCESFLGPPLKNSSHVHSTGSPASNFAHFRDRTLIQSDQGTRQVTAQPDLGPLMKSLAGPGV